MITFIGNNRDWLNLQNTLCARVPGFDLKFSHERPETLPCFAISQLINQGLDFKVNFEFITKQDAHKLIRHKNKK